MDRLLYYDKAAVGIMMNNELGKMMMKKIYRTLLSAASIVSTMVLSSGFSSGKLQPQYPAVHSVQSDHNQHPNSLPTSPSPYQKPGKQPKIKDNMSQQDSQGKNQTDMKHMIENAVNESMNKNLPHMIDSISKTLAQHNQGVAPGHQGNMDHAMQEAFKHALEKTLGDIHTKVVGVEPPTHIDPSLWKLLWVLATCGCGGSSGSNNGVHHAGGNDHHLSSPPRNFHPTPTNPGNNSAHIPSHMSLAPTHIK